MKRMFAMALSVPSIRSMRLCGFCVSGWLRLAASLALLVVATRPAAADEQTSAFGSSTESEASFIGVMYDLKQTQDHQPTNVDPETYTTVMDEFLASGWDENVLNRYYRVSRPLYTTQIFVPNMNADKAPEAFGAQKTVKPSRWVIHYKAQVSPPSGGTYRFWGIADDIMAAAVNGKTVLVGARRDMHMPKMGWVSSERPGAHAGDGNLIAGDWMTFQQGEIIDLDVIIGERPGGLFNAFLYWEKQGDNYDTDNRGHPILPILQLAPYNTPPSDNAKFATGFPIWKSYQ